MIADERITNSIPFFNAQRYRIIVISRFASLFKELQSQSPNFKERKTENNLSLTESPEEEAMIPGTQENISNQIDIEKIRNGTEIRTTIVLKNISKKNKIPDIVYLLRQNGISNYDLIYLPLKKKSKKNFGFAFINFKDPKYILDFYQKFQLKVNEQIGKFYQAFYCHIQGFQKIRNHYDAKFLYIVNY
ncbi:MAG: hypothetical protein MJ252_05220 [archaeon]|nr:hypothetical protein [archaeon]